MQTRLSVVAGTDSAPEAPAASDEPLTQRRCGRCQRSFDGDPTLYVQTDWALCPECSEILLPGRPGGRS
jgi:hypothetical protein